jgi:hypothetical protein
MHIYVNTTYTLKKITPTMTQTRIFDFHINASLLHYPLVYHVGMDVQARCSLHLHFTMEPSPMSQKCH